MQLRDLTREIRETDHRLAPGSETPLMPSEHPLHHPSRKEMCREAGITWGSPGYRERLAAVRETLPCVVAHRAALAAWEASPAGRAYREEQARLQARLDQIRREAEQPETLEQWRARREAERAREAELRRERRRVFARLRAMGFRRERTSGPSAYYRRGGLVVRVSDHEVPMTAERSHNRESGGRTWAESRWSLVLGEDDADAWLEDVQDFIAANPLY